MDCSFQAMRQVLRHMAYLRRRRGFLTSLLSFPVRGWVFLQRHRSSLSMSHTRRTFAKTLSAVGLAVGVLGVPGLAQAADTIKVGILHSLSGTMAISETVLKDVALMTIDEINAKGGVMGKKLEPVVVDPASNWPLFA